MFEHGSDFGPIATAVAALAAAGFAFYTVSTNRSIARKRATLDFFLRTETDKAALDMWAAYTSGLDQLRNSDVASFKSYHPSHYGSIRSYLNVFELMCCGIGAGILDAKMCKRFFHGTLIDARDDCMALIKQIHTEEQSTSTYCDLIEIAKKWESEQ